MDGIAGGVWILAATHHPTWRLFGAGILGIGFNYLPLAIHAVLLSRAGVLERRLAGVNIGSERRNAKTQLLWLVIPFAVALLVVLEQTRRSLR